MLRKIKKNQQKIVSEILHIVHKFERLFTAIWRFWEDFATLHPNASIANMATFVFCVGSRTLPSGTSAFISSISNSHFNRTDAMRVSQRKILGKIGLV